MRKIKKGKNFKKIIAMIMVVAMITVVFTGCSSIVEGNTGVMFKTQVIQKMIAMISGDTSGDKAEDGGCADCGATKVSTFTTKAPVLNENGTIDWSKDWEIQTITGELYVVGDICYQTSENKITIKDTSGSYTAQDYICKELSESTPNAAVIKMLWCHMSDEDRQKLVTPSKMWQGGSSTMFDTNKHFDFGSFNKNGTKVFALEELESIIGNNQNLKAKLTNAIAAYDANWYYQANEILLGPVDINDPNGARYNGTYLKIVDEPQSPYDGFMVTYKDRTMPYGSHWNDHGNSYYGGEFSRYEHLVYGIKIGGTKTQTTTSTVDAKSSVKKVSVTKKTTTKSIYNNDSLKMNIPLKKGSKKTVVGKLKKIKYKWTVKKVTTNTGTVDKNTKQYIRLSNTKKNTCNAKFTTSFKKGYKVYLKCAITGKKGKKSKKYNYTVVITSKGKNTIDTTDTSKIADAPKSVTVAIKGFRVLNGHYYYGKEKQFTMDTSTVHKKTSHKYLYTKDGLLYKDNVTATNHMGGPDGNYIDFSDCFKLVK